MGQRDMEIQYLLKIRRNLSGYNYLRIYLALVERFCLGKNNFHNSPKPIERMIRNHNACIILWPGQHVYSRIDPAKGTG